MYDYLQVNTDKNKYSFEKTPYMTQRGYMSAFHGSITFTLLSSPKDRDKGRGKGKRIVISVHHPQLCQSSKHTLMDNKIVRRGRWQVEDRKSGNYYMKHRACNHVKLDKPL